MTPIKTVLRDAALQRALEKQQRWVEAYLEQAAVNAAAKKAAA